MNVQMDMLIYAISYSVHQHFSRWVFYRHANLIYFTFCTVSLPYNCTVYCSVFDE